MKTNDLIDLMAQESQLELTPMRSLTLSVVVTMGISFVLLVSFWGIRPDMAQVISEPLVLIKQLIPALIAIPCLWLLKQSRHPETSLEGRLRWGLIPAAIAIALVTTTLYILPANAWLTTIVGTTLIACLFSIPALGAPILIGMLWVLKQGAPSDPKTAGAIAGIAAGCLSTIVYALHCYEDSPAFYGIWYTASILMTGLIGQRLGPRFLNW